MMLKKSSVFFLFLFIFLIRCNENDDTNEDFVPSKDWQPVRKGQKIPKELNVETDQEPENKQDDPLQEDLETENSLDDLNFPPKIDAEVIANLLKRHKDILNNEKADQEQLLPIIDDLNSFAHHHDNAKEFVNQNGFHDIIYPNLNSTHPSVKKETLKLMTALMQNKVQPKIHAFETDAVDTLLRLINQDPDLIIKHRALTALGALLRSFGVAQKKFVESEGLSLFPEFYEPDNIRIQIEFVSLISHLVDEHMFAGIDVELLPYYRDFDLSSRMVEHDWCKRLNRLLMGILITDNDDHDSMEMCLMAMRSLRVKGHCGDKFDRDILKKLKKRYQGLKEENAGGSDRHHLIVFSVLEELCDQILEPVHTRNSVKTEL